MQVFHRFSLILLDNPRKFVKFVAGVLGFPLKTVEPKLFIDFPGQILEFNPVFFIHPDVHVVKFQSV